MGKTYRDAYRFSTDVLVIGGGMGGAWAAKTAAKQVRDVLVVDKGPRDWGGLGSMSGGDMICMQPEDDVNDLLDDLVYYYDGLCEQDVLEKILVECMIKGQELTILVEDRGCGIADVHQAMEPLFTTKPDSERCGMGFAFMEAFMDSLEVESSPGKGTRVTMKKKIGRTINKFEQ